MYDVCWFYVVSLQACHSIVNSLMWSLDSNWLLFGQVWIRIRISSRHSSVCDATFQIRIRISSRHSIVCDATFQMLIL